MITSINYRTLTFFLIIILMMNLPSILSGSTSGKLKIINYQNFLNKKFKKRRRISTRYIIIHTSEAGKISTLRTLSGGKRVGRRRTKGGHANYAIQRDGKIYRILNHKYRADHTGVSMWNGVKDLSSHSIGIELVGYHYGTITFEQYRSLTPLLKELQIIYKIPDKNILTHSQVSYGKPNLWFKKDHRGRKRCALNFNRLRAGLAERWKFDPDVRSKRLTSDFQTKRVFYSNFTTGMTRISPSKRETIEPIVTELEKKTEEVVLSSNIISLKNTAWNIAGEEYNDQDTIYLLPDGKKVRGNKVGSVIGWGTLPGGTKVFLNQPEKIENSTGPVYTITGNLTAWSFAGNSYKKNSTFYIFPSGKIKNGKKIRDWDSLPAGVKMLIGYKSPNLLGSKKGGTAWGIAGKSFNSRTTVYFIPGKGLITGDRMGSFNDLPKNSKIFLKRR